MNVVEKEKVVSVAYQLFNNTTGELVEEVNSNNPLTFIFGTGQLLNEFENNLEGLREGDEFEFVINHKNAYGEVNPQAITELDKNIFMVNGQLMEDILFVGNVIPMRDSQGHRLDGKVLEIKDKSVVMDFNHPMAGVDLNFKGSVVSVREATEEELKNGLQAPSCGCGEAGCESEDCGDGGQSCNC